jgi:hypothetical protein
VHQPPRFNPPLPERRLAALRVPAGLALVPGGSRLFPLPLREPPRATLDSNAAGEILALLDYAGVRYADANCPAASLGMRVFAAGRRLGRHGPHQAVSFDWDHTLSNFQIFEDLPNLLRVRWRQAAPSARLAARPMVAIEMARPFMTEFAFGTLAGFALRQGLTRLAHWDRYRPQVCVATHTWPDRLGLMAAHFMPILPLMEGLLPGAPETYARFTAPGVKCALHLHHFLDYATGLLQRLDALGPAALSGRERDEVAGLLQDGRAHHRKPLGAWAMRGWDTGTLLHVDDATQVVADHARQAAADRHPGARAVHVRHPHSPWLDNVQEWHKVSAAALWRSREHAILRVARRLAWKEAAFPCLATLLAAFDDDAHGDPRMPQGVVMPVHETPTTLGEFWRYYVEPGRRAKMLIRAVARRHPRLAADLRARHNGASPAA